MTDERIQTGYAALQTDSGDVPIQVSGIAIGEGDITRGGSGKKTLWPRETLEAAAEGLQGQPLATDENHTADGAQPQTPSKAVIGEITWSGYKPGVGVLYEAEVDDPDIARSVENGRLEVSPLVAREVEPLEDHPDAEFKATEITRWRDLATVVDGAAPSNEITVGGNPMKAEALHKAVEALQEDIALTPPEAVQDHAEEVLAWRADDEKDVQGMTDTGWNRAEQLASGEELSASDVQEIAAWFARHGEAEYELNEEGMNPWEDNGRVAIKGWGGPPMRSWIMDKREQLTEAGELEAMSLEALKEVAGVEFEATMGGDLDESEIPNDDYESHYLYPADTKSDSSYPVVDAEGNLRKGNVDAAWNLGARGGVDAEEHDERLMQLAQEFDTPPEWAQTESMAEFSELSDDDLVEWDSSGGTAQGRIVDLRDEGEPDYDDEIDGDVTVSPPAALIEIVGMDDGEIVGQETMVAHKPDTLTVIEESDVEAMSKHMDSLEDIPEEYVFDNPGEAMSKAQEMGVEEIHSHGDGDDTVFMPGATHEDLLEMLDAQSDDGTQESMSPSSAALAVESTTMNDDEINAVVNAAESIDDPVDRVESLAAADDPKIVEQDTYEALNEAVNTLDEMMAERLIEETGISENAVDAMSFEAKSAHFETDEGDFDAEALVQNPETGDPDETETEALSEDADTEKAEALYADMEEYGVDHSDTICEALGVDEWDTAKEVLN